MNDLYQLYIELKLVLIRIKAMSMTQRRLNHCMLFAIYKEVRDKLSLTDIANGLVVKVLDSQSRSPVFRITGWLQDTRNFWELSGEK